MASAAATRRPSFEKKRSTSNVNLSTNRSSSTVNLAANDDDTLTTGHRPHKTKQFVVHANRHHSRVPSYGRNLNKLSKLTLAHDGGGTSKGHHLERGGSNGRKSVKSVDVEQVATEVRRQNNHMSKKPAFEIGDSDEETANEEEVAVKHSPVKRANGLKKSSSTKSLEKQEGARREVSAGERLERTQRERPNRSVKERPDKVEGLTDRLDKPEQSDSQEKEAVAVQLQLSRQQSQIEPMASSARTLVNRDAKRHSAVEETSTDNKCISNARLFGQVVNSAAAPPKLNAEYATGMHTPASSTGIPTTPFSNQTPHTPASSTGGPAAPSNIQSLTSRFIDSLDHTQIYTPVSPSYSRIEPRQPQPTNDHPGRDSPIKSLLSQRSSPPLQKLSLSGCGSSTISIPSRTQQKLWLQRQFDEDAQQVSAKKAAQTGPGGVSYPPISQREFERMTKEFYNVRRFKDPVGETLERIKDHPKLQKRIPRKGLNGAEQERGMGLSQSLNAGMGKSHKTTHDKGLRGSRDDSGIGDNDSEGSSSRRDPNVEALLKQLWNRQFLLTSNE